MVEVTFVQSVQGHQVERVNQMADKLRAERADATVRVVEGEAAKSLLKLHKLNFGPAILIDGRLEYVGVPRWRFLVERLAQVARRLPNPRTAAPPEAARPAAAKPGTPAKPSPAPAEREEAPVTKPSS